MQQLVLAAAAILSIAANPIDSVDRAGIERAITIYNDGLIAGDPVRVRSAIGESMFMFNGAFSSDPSQWEAHMYVPPERLETWLGNFVGGAGPHRNHYRIVAMNVRANAAVVTTEDSGSNRFRKWDNERVTWTLGKREGQWKIIGFFIRDIRNPG